MTKVSAAHAAGAERLLRVCGQVKAGEEAAIVYDDSTEEVARIIGEAAARMEAIPVLIRMPARKADGQEPPDAVAAAMAAADIFLTPVSRSITHTRAVQNAIEGGGRGLVLTQWEVDLLVRPGLQADFPGIAPHCRALGAAFARGNELTVTAPGGTDMTLDIRGRRGNALTCIVGPGEFSPVPTIEANVSPVERSARGWVVADVSVPYAGIGILDEPIRAEIRDGMVVGLEGGHQARRLEEVLHSFQDPMSYNVAELGIGMNPEATVTGFMLEDEAVARTAHLGIGTSITLGGEVKAASHYDLLFWHPTVAIDGEVAVEDGRVLV